ncbi:MAG: response regulator [Chlorobium sp.]|nr:response regulator [Chlorobium sp.]
MLSDKLTLSLGTREATLIRMLIHDVRELLATTMGLDHLLVFPLQTAPASGFEDSISSLVGMAGTLNGVLGLHMPRSLAIKTTSTILGMEVTEIDDNVNNTLMKMTTLIAGALQQRLAKNGVCVQLSMPSVISGKTYEVYIRSNFEQIAVNFANDNSGFTVSVVFDGNNTSKTTSPQHKESDRSSHNGQKHLNGNNLQETFMHHPAKILIADDNPNIHEILETLFISRGEVGATPQIFHAGNGQIALDILVRNSDIDVIILDLNMPVMDGFETLAHLKCDLRLRAIPVCVFSGGKEDAAKALKLGARDFINKPGDYQEIKIRVLNLVENKRRAEAGEQAKINFLSTVSHELRTPMNGVLGFTQLLKMTILTDDQTKYIELLEQSAKNMMNLVSGVFTFLESENPLHNLPLTPFFLRKTVQESVDRLSLEMKTNGVILESDIHPDLPDTLLGLPDKIQEILYHLLSNAIKFSPSGKVSVVIKPGKRDAASVQLNCSVTDNGIDITPETQSLIFEPFTQADTSSTRKFGGLGIGLSIASRIVQMLGGSINIESRPEGGSIFSFTVVCSLEQSIY